MKAAEKEWLEEWCRNIETKWNDTKLECASANHLSVWSAQLDGPALFMLGIEVTEDNFAKPTFDRSAKLY